MNTTQNTLAKKLTAAFEEQHADFFATLNEPPSAIVERMAALILLDPAAQASFQRVGSEENLNCLDKNFRRFWHQQFADLLNKTLAQKLIKLVSNGTVQFAVEPTSEALAQHTHLEQLAGLKPMPAPAPKPLSAAEQLTREVLEDYNGVRDGKKVIKAPLPMTQFREKHRTRKEYREEYQRLADTNQLESQITSAYSGSDLVVGG